MLAGHYPKCVTALALDAGGSRLVTGGNDYKVRLWDFGGMTQEMKHFRAFEPHESHQVKAVSFSPSGSEFLVTTGSAHAKVYSRDGVQLLETMKGDMYITDMARTKGHVSMLTGGAWHPTEKNLFLTCSIDGTLRLWDITAKLAGVDQHLPQKAVIKAKSARNTRLGVLTCCYAPDGSRFAAACEDGSLQVWSSKPSSFSKPDVIIRDAHTPGSETSSVKFFSDGQRLLSRGGDDTMKLWDIRSPNQPVHVWSDLPNLVAQTDVCLSPDEHLILTGTSVGKNDTGNGRLVIFNADTFESYGELGISPASVVKVLWPAKINQIIVASSDGRVRMLYDPVTSTKGALLFVNRKARQKQPEDFNVAMPIINPHALPMYRDSSTKNRKRQREKERLDPIKSHKPELPMSGPGRGGRLMGTGTLTQTYMKAIFQKPEDEMDVRDSILRHAKEAEESSIFTAAYAKTQPKPIYDESLLELEEQEKAYLADYMLEKKCTKCGMKLCCCGAKSAQ
eukprot:GILI01022508.1.p1 GENE.GILI01022508.1~~GILI01022508.1.p1  ORF type:complete len:507 (-),score=129.06 GILI01022508.1:144-1664(-)